jgi:hypothetical protein
MVRNIEAETEMINISKEIWEHLKGNRIFPRIESRQGGSSGAYYSNEHIIRFRWNVWNKMPLAGKRMLAIHELYHAKGNHHNSENLFCHAFDILTIEFYKKIYGEDKEYREVLEQIRKLI